MVFKDEFLDFSMQQSWEVHHYLHTQMVWRGGKLHHAIWGRRCKSYSRWRDKIHHYPAMIKTSLKLFAFYNRELGWKYNEVAELLIYMWMDWFCNRVFVLLVVSYPRLSLRLIFCYIDYLLLNRFYKYFGMTQFHAPFRGKWHYLRINVLPV